MDARPGDDAADAQPEARRPAPDAVLLVDKPAGITSHGVVARARRGLGTRKVGHAGTLDPMATGLLVLGVGSATRLLTWIVGADKTYEATIRLGAGSNTDDAEGELGPVASESALADVSDEAIVSGVAALTGDLLQRPSAVSAIKVDGKRAYALVREGETVELPARPVTVRRFEVLSIDRGAGFIDVAAVVDCTSGTYIRALARDLGESLGVGGHLTALRRTRVGPFRVEDAASLDDDLPVHLTPPAAVAEKLFPVVALDEQAAIDLGHGKRITLGTPDASPVAALDPSGRLVGLVEISRGVARVLVNFPAPAADSEGAP
ncbi:tRNA pseudouridine55 synthase [Leifsonia sp. AK011]|uniref:tRNA pseudouridine(55) synthase TruB n=1 Tax=Leifsonia sp. AK011 TaxID=2723075 RepID=UPI0015CCCA2D|nr:tRNA pseudouridine(55) synthase TruB [Leifsonia sp. AK011]NYF10405.1 tRNA pseudouridine55 synthase [Leifsonia sp. AK011]